MATDPVRRRWVQADGRLLHQLDFGGAGRPVVCLHGVTSCAWVWHHVARHLSSAGHVLASDLRGHGDSGWAPPDHYRTVDHAADLASLLAGPLTDSLESGPVDLVGSSWGALVGLAVAATRPELVRRLVLVDIEPSFSQSETDVPDRPARLADLDEATAEWRAANPSAPEDLLRLVAAAATRPAPGGGLVPADDPLFLTRWPFRSEDWWAALDVVEAPTLVVHAEKSWVRAEVCDQMAARLKRSERADLAGSAHVVPLDAPEELGLRVARFLQAKA